MDPKQELRLVDDEELHLPTDTEHRVGGFVGRSPPPTDRVPDEDRYVAQSGSTWTIEELTALARDSLVEEPDD